MNYTDQAYKEQVVDNNQIIQLELSNKLLKQKTEDFNFKDPPIDPNILAMSLMNILHKYGAYGIAANQCNLPYRVFALNTDPCYVCFNPKIVYKSPELSKLDEGCLSFPGKIVPIKRPDLIRARFQGPDGVTYTRTFTGITSHSFQHELNHLDGVLFYEHVSRYHREKILK